MKAIIDYAPIVIKIESAKAAKKGKPYDPEKDGGFWGKCLELAVKDYYHKPLTLSPAGYCDIRIGSRNVEVKNGAGGLGSVGRQLLKGSGLVLYIPVLYPEYPLTRQDGYVMERPDFLDALEEAGAIRGKDGSRITIQTFWNRSKNKPHGKLLSKMLDAFEARENTELWAYLEETKVGA